MSFLDNLTNETNYTYTENGAVTHKTTTNAVYDMFAFGGAYRRRNEYDCILLFKNAFEQDEVLALKCLFYLRDIRGGQGERRFFRTCFNWLCRTNPAAAIRNLDNIAEYGRWDDLIYATGNTQIEDKAMEIIQKQFMLDLECITPSLLAKWMPSENASSDVTKEKANKVRKFLGLSHKEYRKALSLLRKRINVLERLMSANEWDKIVFDQIPSKAGIKYKNAFARRDIIAEKYKEFAENTETTVNASALYPYDVAHQAFQAEDISATDAERLMIQKYWDNLPDYYQGRQENGLAIVDTSGSMCGRPMEAAVSLGAYIAEKAHGPFANHFITFSSHPDLIKFEGIDITDKFNRAINADWGMNTNIEAVFDLLLNTALKNNTPADDMPSRLYIFSDMEFDGCINGNNVYHCRANEIDTLLEGIAKKWEANGYNLPPVIFWNLDARQNNIPMLKGRFSYVSGLSPVMIENILSGIDGWDLCLQKLNSKRYEAVK